MLSKVDNAKRPLGNLVELLLQVGNRFRVFFAAAKATDDLGRGTYFGKWVFGNYTGAFDGGSTVIGVFVQQGFLHLTGLRPEFSRACLKII